MTLVDLVTALALLEYLVFVLAVGRARGRFGVAAPATTGNPDFERYLRVQMNTLESLIIVIPCLYLFARYISEPLAAALGIVFIIGRAMYFFGYTRAANKRSWGYMVSSMPMLALLIGSIIGPAIAWFKS